VGNALEEKKRTLEKIRRDVGGKKKRTGRKWRAAGGGGKVWGCGVGNWEMGGTEMESFVKEEKVPPATFCRSGGKGLFAGKKGEKEESNMTRGKGGGEFNQKEYFSVWRMAGHSVYRRGALTRVNHPGEGNGGLPEKKASAEFVNLKR